MDIKVVVYMQKRTWVFIIMCTTWVIVWFLLCKQNKKSNQNEIVFGSGKRVLFSLYYTFTDLIACMIVLFCTSENYIILLFFHTNVGRLYDLRLGYPQKTYFCKRFEIFYIWRKNCYIILCSMYLKIKRNSTSNEWIMLNDCEWLIYALVLCRADFVVWSWKFACGLEKMSSVGVFMYTYLK